MEAVRRASMVDVVVYDTSYASTSASFVLLSGKIKLDSALRGLWLVLRLRRDISPSSAGATRDSQASELCRFWSDPNVQSRWA